MGPLPRRLGRARPVAEAAEHDQRQALRGGRSHSLCTQPHRDGHVRAHETKTGKIIWDFDTAREFSTVNGIPAKGGSMAATGATVADGMLYVNSGYSNMPGNVLLAFGAR